jgi:hypothetical protein
VIVSSSRSNAVCAISLIARGATTRCARLSVLRTVALARLERTEVGLALFAATRARETGATAAADAVKDAISTLR